jgi:hypothetical protein
MARWDKSLPHDALPGLPSPRADHFVSSPALEVWMNDIVLQLRSHNLVIAVDVPRRDDLLWASGPQSEAPIRPSALSCRRAHRGEEKNAATTEGSFSGVHRHGGSRARLSRETTTPAVAGATM